MDTERFDELAKNLGGGASRRGVLRGAGGGALGALLGAAGLAASAAPEAARKKGKKEQICFCPGGDQTKCKTMSVGAKAAAKRVERGTAKKGPCGGNGGGGGGSGASDIDVLNFALTLEHLEYAFYRDGLAIFSADDFAAADFGPPAYERLEVVREHEEIHVDTLTAVILDLGGDPVGEAPCYNFVKAYSSVANFLATAQLLENTGVMAYDGAIALIDSPELQTAGATIATVEARHAAYLNDLNGDSPFPAAFDTPLSMAEVLAAAAPFFDCEGDGGGGGKGDGKKDDKKDDKKKK